MPLKAPEPAPGTCGHRAIIGGIVAGINDRAPDPRPISTSNAYAYPSTVAVSLAPFGVVVNPTTNRVYVTNNGTSAKPSTSVSVLDGTTNTIVTTVMPNIGDVKTSIGGFASTGTVTGNVSKAITSLGKTWSGKNMTIGQAGVGTQLTDCFAKLVPILAHAPVPRRCGCATTRRCAAHSLQCTPVRCTNASR